MLSLISYRGFRAGVWTVYALGILFVLLTFIPGSGYLVDNTANEPKPPVAYRVLVRTMADTAYHVIPKAVENAITPTLIDIRDNRHVRALMRIPPKYGPPYKFRDNQIYRTFVMLLVVIGWFIAFLMMLIKLTRALFPHSEACAVIAPLLFLWLLPTFFHRYAYTYDFAELFFACACMYLLYVERWWLYIVCFIFATLTKETSVFMIGFFAIWYATRLPKALYIQLLVLQLVLYISIEAVIISSYSWVAHTHGGRGLHVFWRLFREQLNYTYGYSYYSFIAGVGTWLLMLYRWEEKPTFLLGCLWLVLGNVVVYLFCCNDGEYRDLFWCMPTMILLATHSIVSITNMDHWPLFQKMQPQENQ